MVRAFQDDPHPLGGSAVLEVARWFLWTAGVVAGVASLLALGQRAACHKGFRWRGGQSLPRGSRTALLHDAIVGNTKQAVASVFGPPPTATGWRRLAAASPGSSAPPAYLEADTWYYPIDPDRKRAMAIQFDRGLARRVEFIETPRLGDE
ncbi:MAG: hypothetical protein ACREIT_03035 [Tepidisphaeraceae bacterium]